MTDIDPAAFGLPTDVNGQVGFMYADDNDLAVDENDPIYRQVRAAMEADAKARGVEPTPLPGTEKRPPELIAHKEGDNAADPEAADGNGQPDLPPAATDSAPPAATVTPPVGTEADAAIPPTAADTFALSIDGQDYTINTAQAEYLLRVNSWLEAVPDDTKQAWAAIEQGTAVAVSIEELTRLRAAAAAPAKPAATPQPPDIDSLDDETIAYIRSLESRVSPITAAPSTDAGPGQIQQPSPSDIAAAAQRQAERGMQMRQELAAVNTQWQTQWGLTDEQMERVTQVATELAVVPNISRQRTQYSPTGQIIREASFPDVIREAYEIAMNADPTLRAVRDEMIYTQRVAHDAQRNSATNAKKALAGSLATSPSAAVPASGAAPKIGPDNKMNLQDTSNAIAKAIAEMQEQS